MSLDTDLSKTLVEVAAAASDAQDDWWIIGSAAVALHGRSVPHIKDVDLLMSVRDAEAFLRRVGVEPAGGKATELFRSVYSEPGMSRLSPWK